MMAKIKIKNDIIKRPVMLAYYILILVAIFNTNKYHASIAFIFPAVILTVMLCLFNLTFSRKKLSDYFPILLVCISSIFSTYFSDVVQWSPAGTSFLIFAALYILLTAREFSGEQIKAILNFYARITLILASFLLLNLILSNNLINGRVSITMLGVRKDENYLSAYMVFGFFYFVASYLWGSQKKRCLLYAACIFVSAFMTGSRAGLLAMLVCTFIMIIKYVFFEKTIVKTVLATAGIGVGIVAIYILLSGTPLFSRMSDAEGYTENIRIVIWGFAMEAFLRRPWIGSGIQSGTFFAQQHVRWFTHSCFVDLITSIGLIGAFLFMWQYMKYCKVKRGNLIFLLAMMAILFVPLMFVNGFETLTFWLPMSLCKVVSDFCKENECREILM